MAKKTETNETTTATEAPAKKAQKKTECPITRAQFKKAPGILTGSFNNQNVIIEKKEFSTGSLGWYFNGRITVEVDGVACVCQVGTNITIIGSKELPLTK